MNTMQRLTSSNVGSDVSSFTTPPFQKNSPLSSLNLLPRFNTRSSEAQPTSSSSQRSRRKVVLNSVSRGLWIPSLTPGINYVDQAGTYAIGEGYYLSNGLPVGDLFRNFLSFRLPRLKKGETITKATLNLTRFGSSAGDPFETLGFFDVSTPFSTLNSSIPIGVNPLIYEDLGSGKNYGLFSVSTVGNFFDTISFRLTKDAVRDINRSRSRLFSIGSSILSLNDTGATLAENLFTASNASGVVQIVLKIRTKPT